MNTEIDYSDFNVKRMGNLDIGTHFLWAGQLYQKIEHCWVQEQNIKGNLETEWIYKNAIKVDNGKHFYFFDEELVVPVEAQIKVRQNEDKP
tara:strand:- start:113 stop:385 length:273 start_codon:yes stop_codon:yes gene_type:complete